MNSGDIIVNAPSNWGSIYGLAEWRSDSICTAVETSLNEMTIALSG
jgi:hypothetical protein